MAVAKIAGRQHGVISVRQLREVGLGRNAVTMRVQAGRLHRLHRGVYAVGNPAPSPQGGWMAAVLACGRIAEGEGLDFRRTVLGYWNAALSHRCAACLWGMLPGGGKVVDVSVLGDGGKRRRRGIRLHRSLTLSSGHVTLRDGIPVTTPARTIADLRRLAVGPGRFISAYELRQAIRQANVLGLSTDEEARRERSRSDLELDFLHLCHHHRLPTPEANVRIGPHLVDFLWRKWRVVVETDGYGSHRGRAAFQEDRGRDLDLRTRGFEVIRLSEKQVNDEAPQVVAALRRALRVGADAPGFP
jgi:very-short-patch-repair endonuclease